MTLAVRNRAVTVASDASLRPAGADEAEADTAQRVAADPSVIDAERHPLYGHGVENAAILVYCSSCHKTHAARPRERECAPGAWREDDSGLPWRGFATSAEAVAWAEGRPLIPLQNAANVEAVRKSRLSRWQEQR